MPDSAHSRAPLVRFTDAALSYDGITPASTGVNFVLSAGEALALIGPNGAGKSTILKGLLGLVTAIGGSITAFGGSPRHAAAKIGYLPQHHDSDPEFPVSLRQVVLMGRFRGLGPFRWPGRADGAAADRALARVGLSEHADRRFGDLSGGQQQRGLLARALVSEPRVLLLDEPFNGLDTPNRQALMRTLRELRDDGIAIIVSTHDLELAHQVCSHALLMNREQIAFGAVDEVLTPALVTETFGESDEHHDTHCDHLAHPHRVEEVERRG